MAGIIYQSILISKGSAGSIYQSIIIIKDVADSFNPSIVIIKDLADSLNPSIVFRFQKYQNDYKNRFSFRLKPKRFQNEFLKQKTIVLKIVF